MKVSKTVALMLLAALLICLRPVCAMAETDEPAAYSEEECCGGYAGETFTVRTPSDEPNTLYVSGHVTPETKALAVSAVGDGGSFLRVFVFPDENGDFSIAVDTGAGSTAVPEAAKGRVVADETGGQTGRRCCSTKPGYAAVPELDAAFCRITIAGATKDWQVDGIYDEDADYRWYDESNPLSGSQGYACKEFVLYVENNCPHLIRYPDVLANNDAVRSADGTLTQGTPAWTEYTDVYLRDLEGILTEDGVNYPVTEEQADYFRSFAAEITREADGDYEKALRIYEFVAANFYYDNYAYQNDLHVCSNPYVNLCALSDGSTGVNRINGKVATVCTGYAALVAALCRAEGIPVRVVNGFHITGTKTVWSSQDGDYHSTVTHWWTEAYIGGRWVVIDANRGSGSRWVRTDWTVADDETWQKADHINYAGFDMTPYALSGSYNYLNVFCTQNYVRDIPAPENLRADILLGYVHLTWDAVPDAECYYIYRGGDLGSIRYYAYAGGSSTEWFSLDEPEEPGHTYYYRIAARIGGTAGIRSRTVSACVSAEEHAGALQPPVIDSQPESLSAEIGAEASFTVAAHNGTLSYKWQYYSEANDAWYTPSGSAYSGTDSPCMTVSVTEARNGMRYRCVISNELFSVTSEEAVLTAEARPPVITRQPTSASGYLGSQVVFSTEAEGSSVSYKWQYYDASSETWKGIYSDYCSGTDTPALTVTVRQSFDGREYRCRISNLSGSVVTDSVTLTVRPEITAQPKSTSVYRGDSAVFSVKATGSDLLYQWQYRTGASGAWHNCTVDGAKTASLSVVGTGTRDGYQYRCRIKRGPDTVYSQSATLSVKSNVVTQPKDKSAWIGDSAVFTVKAAGSAPTYQWQYRTDSAGTWKATAMAGNKTPTLTVPVTAARNGYQYRCKVTNNGQVSYSDAATLTAKDIITYQPWDAWAFPGDDTFFRVSAHGSDLSFQWQYRTGENGKWYSSRLEGAQTSELTLKAKNARNGYQYRCKITNGAVTVYTETVTLHIKRMITSQPKSVSGKAGTVAVFTVGVADGVSPAFRWQYSTDGGATWKSCSLKGYNTDTLSVKITSARSGYMYRCRLTNGGETVYSNAVTLRLK